MPCWKTSRRFASGYSKGDPGSQSSRRPNSHQVAPQAGVRPGEGQDRTSQCECSQVQFTCFLEVVFGGTGGQVAGLLSAISTAGDTACRKGQQCKGCAGQCKDESCCLQIDPSQVRPSHGAARHGDGERRRGGLEGIKRCCQYQRPEDHRRFAASRGKSQNPECQCGRNDDRRTSLQKTANRRGSHRVAASRSGRSCKQFWRWLVFLIGRASMTQEYAVQWPYDSGTLPDAVSCVLKWTHSVLHETDFLSEWEAAHRATELALQCHSSIHHPEAHPRDRTKKHVGSASVTFAPWVDVCLGCEDAWDLFHTKVHVDALQESFKPWSSHHLPGCSFVTHEKFDYQKDLWVPIPELFAGFIPPVFNSNSDLPGSATCDDPLSLCEAVLIPGMQTTCLSDDSFVAPHAVDAVLSSGVDAHTTCGFSPRYADVPFCPPVPEWTSLTPIRCPNEPTAPSSSSGPAGHGNTDAGADS